MTEKAPKKRVRYDHAASIKALVERVGEPENLAGKTERLSEAQLKRVVKEGIIDAHHELEKPKRKKKRTMEAAPRQVNKKGAEAPRKIEPEALPGAEGGEQVLRMFGSEEDLAIYQAERKEAREKLHAELGALSDEAVQERFQVRQAQFEQELKARGARPEDAQERPDDLGILYGELNRRKLPTSVSAQAEIKESEEEPWGPLTEGEEPKIGDLVRGVGKEGRVRQIIPDKSGTKWVRLENNDHIPLTEITERQSGELLLTNRIVEKPGEQAVVGPFLTGDEVEWNPGGGVVPQRGKIENFYSDPETKKIYAVFETSQQRYPIEEIKKLPTSTAELIPEGVREVNPARLVSKEEQEVEEVEVAPGKKRTKTENEMWLEDQLSKERERYSTNYLAWRRNQTRIRKLAEGVGAKDKYTKFSKSLEKDATAFDKARAEAAAYLSGKASLALRERWEDGARRKLVRAGRGAVQERYEQVLFNKLTSFDRLVVTEAEHLIAQERAELSPQKERVYKKVFNTYLRTNRWVKIGFSTAIVSGVAASLGAFAGAGAAGAAGFAGYRYARAALGMVVGTAFGMRVRKEMEESTKARGEREVGELKHVYRPLDESAWKKYRAALGRMERGKKKAVVGQVLTAALVGGGVAAFSDPVVRPIGEAFKAESPGTTARIPQPGEEPLTQEEFERRTRVSRMEPAERPAAPPFRVDVALPRPPIEAPPVPPSPIPEATPPESIRPAPPPVTSEPQGPRPPSDAERVPPEPNPERPSKPSQPERPSPPPAIPPEGRSPAAPPTTPKEPEAVDRFVEIKPKESYPIEIRRGDSPWATMRRFVDEHLWTQSLSPEQRVYTTDYLTKRLLAASPQELQKWGINPDSIKGFRTGAGIGTSIDYSGLLRDPALDQELLKKTLELTPEQLKNLEQYIPQRSEIPSELGRAEVDESQVELASHKNESAVAPEKSAPQGVEIRRGDSPWATMRRFVDQHEEFKKLSPSQKMQATSFLTNKMLIASPEQLNRWGIDPEKLKGFRSGMYNGESIIGKSIDYSSLMQDSALKQELFGKAVGPAMRGPSVEVPPETPRPKVPTPTEPPTGRKIPSLTDQPGRGIRIPDTAARPRTDIGIGAKSVTPGTPAEMSPQVEGKMIEILRRDVYRMFGSRGILGLGASDGFEFVRQYARTQVLEVFTAEGAQGKLATFRQYLLDLSKETGVKARPGEAVEPFMRRALAVKAQMELERPAPPPPSSPKPPAYEPIPR